MGLIGGDPFPYVGGVIPVRRGKHGQTADKEQEGSMQQPKQEGSRPSIEGVDGSKSPPSAGSGAERRR